ncbi:MAG: hypothetical protein WC878_05770 [Candidatus Paceibacterota bacterium]
MNLSKKIIILLLLLFFAPSVFGAQVSFVSEKSSFAQNEEFLISVFLDTEGETLNAFEGKISFPVDLLEEKEIRSGDSLINFWIEKPSSLTDGKGGKSGEIIFSGITPGGFLGTKGILVSVVFRAKQKGDGIIRGEGLRILKNDGLGTKAEVKTSPFSFSVSEENLVTPSIIPPIKDTEPPENFVPIIVNDPNVFEGKYFVVFLAQDKGSGIDRYEVREGESGSFSPAESPHLLKNQSLDAKIFVKAVDKAGNEKISEAIFSDSSNQSASRLFQGKQTGLIFAVLLALAAIGFLCRKKLWRKNI